MLKLVVEIVVYRVFVSLVVVVVLLVVFVVV